MKQIRLELGHELSLAVANYRCRCRCRCLSRTGLATACLFTTPGAFAETLKVEPR